MADVANCMNASTPTKAHMGQSVPGSPETVVLSPGVKEAMDRIFPRSATQLLQGGLTFGDDPLFSIASVGTTKETVQARNPPVSASALDFSPLQCKSSSAHITTLATTDTAMAASLGIPAPVSRNGSTLVNSYPLLSTESHPSTPAIINIENSKEAVDSESNSLELRKKVPSKIRISKADFEIVTSCDALISEYERTARRVNCVDASSSECHSRDESDSEDMRRPFATIAREKKKRKKKKRKIECNAEKANSCLSEHNVNSGDEFKTTNSWKTNDKSVAVRGPDTSRIVAQKDFITNTVKQISHPDSLLTSTALINKNTLEFSENTHGNQSQVYVLNNGHMNDTCYKDCGTTSEDFSNISYSSAKENVQAEKRRSYQKLPKTKRQHFHIVKHINKIRNTFPPCFVVVKKIDSRNFCTDMKDFSIAESVLPLSVRVKKLLDLCDSGTLACRKNKKMTVTEELVYRNIFEEPPFYGLSEDDFEKPRVRSLRKRDKKISYVEPSEDDILDEYSRKRSRVKNKDCPYEKSGDESQLESKKKKRQDFFNPSAVNADYSCGSRDIATILDQNRGYTEDKEIMERNGRRLNPNEVMVYPRTSLGNTISYHPRRPDGSDMFTSRMDETSMRMLYSQDKNISMVPAPSYISVLSGGAIPAPFPSHPAPVSLFPSLPLGFQGGLAAQPFIGGGPTSCQVSSAGGVPNPHQFCLVKMNGKDVLLRLVPSGGMNAPLPMVLPKGKTLIAPPRPTHMYNQSIQQPHSIPGCTQAMLRPVTSVVTAPQVNAVSAASLQSLYGLPFLSRPTQSSSQNIPFPPYPVMPSSHLTGHMSTDGLRPIAFTSSGAHASHSSFAGQPSLLFSSTNSGTTAPIRSAPLSTLPTQALPPPVAPPAVSISTPMTTTGTFVQSVSVPGPCLQTTAPSQSSSVRSVRIFVPGCSATGTPGRFATLGSIANTSQLTHVSASSSLLPQCNRSCDYDLSPEQRAAKRRRLEKKYPLPPGVVIKTEPLDAPPKPATIITSKSLLSKNLQLLSSPSPGSGIQRFQVISPSLANALSLRNARGNSDVVYRTASVGGGQTVLVPSSMGGLVPTTTPLSLTVSSASSSLASLAASENTIIDTHCTSSASLNTRAISPSYRMSSGSPQFSQSDATERNIYSGTSTDSATYVAASRSTATSHESTVSVNDANRSSQSSDNFFSESVTSASAVTGSNDNIHLYPPRATPRAASPEILRSNLEELRKIVQVQELRGLKGERLEKLKELLSRKQQLYNELQMLANTNTSSAGYESADSRAVIDSDRRRGALDDVDGHGASETDPFVID